MTNQELRQNNWEITEYVNEIKIFVARIELMSQEGTLQLISVDEVDAAQKVAASLISSCRGQLRAKAKEFQVLCASASDYYANRENIDFYNLLWDIETVGTEIFDIHNTE